MPRTPTLRASVLVLVPLAAAACGASDAPGGALPARCQKLVAGLTSCAEQLPADAREPLLQLLKSQRARWEAAAKKGDRGLEDIDLGCRDAIDQVKAATRSACPDAKWE